MDNKHKISVVITTFNGKKYIIEQLDSIREQTIEPDEVIISDDCSTDGTVKIINDYIQKYKLSNWHMIANTINRGWRENFKQTMCIASGDIIFLCDQDDIWHMDKIQKMSEAMKRNNCILLLASNYTPFYQNGGKNVHKVKPTGDKTEVVKKTVFERDFFYTARPGCVYCYRKELNNYFENYYFERLSHDAFLWRISSLLDGLYIYNENLIDYRRHNSNATGRETKNISRKIELTKQHNQIIDQAAKFANNEIISGRDNKIATIERYAKWNNLRLELLTKKEPMIWFKLVPYRQCYYSNKTFFADLGMIILGKIRGE